MTQANGAGPETATNQGGKPFPSGGAAAHAAMGHPTVRAVVEAIDEYIAGYEMTDVLSQDDFLNGLAELLERMGTVCNDLADSWRTETPLDQEIADFLDDFGTDLTGMAETAKQTYERWTQAHEYDLERARNPRTGEEKLDVQPPGA